MKRLFAKLIEPPRDKIPKERQMFSNQDLKMLIVPLIIEQILVMLVGMLVAIHTMWTIVLGTSSGPLPSALRAAGDVKFTMTMAVLGLVIGRMFCSILFSVWMGMGIIGMWLAMGTHWSFNSFGGYFRFRSGKWKNKRIIE